MEPLAAWTFTWRLPHCPGPPPQSHWPWHLWASQPLHAPKVGGERSSARCAVPGSAVLQHVKKDPGSLWADGPLTGPAQFSGAASFFRRAGPPLEFLGPEPVFQAGVGGLALCSGLASPVPASNPTTAVSCGKAVAGSALPGAAGPWRGFRGLLRAAPPSKSGGLDLLCRGFCCFPYFGVTWLLTSRLLHVPIPLLGSRTPAANIPGSI